MLPRTLLVVCAIALGLSLLTGCDTSKVTDAVTTSVDAAKTTVTQTVEAAKQEINLAGSMEVSTSPPISAKACYARLIVVGGDRPAVLQLASYKEPDLERFPSMFIQAPVKVGSLRELNGQTVKADLYAQADKGATVWHTREGAPASIMVSTVDDNSLTAQCTGATLVNAETGEEAVVSGKFIALIE